MNLTRQFIELVEEEGEDEEVMSQLGLTFHFPATAAMEAFGKQNRWCESLAGVDDFVAFITKSAPYVSLKDACPERVETEMGARIKKKGDPVGTDNVGAARRRVRPQSNRRKAMLAKNATWHGNGGAGNADLDRSRRAAAVALPAEYLEFLAFSDGGEGPLGIEPAYVVIDSAGDAKCKRNGSLGLRACVICIV